MTTTAASSPGGVTGPGVAVELTELTRVYAGGVRALDGLTLHMAPGEFIALLGPSGCGKTTALRCLAGLEDPDSGSVVVGGRDLTHVPTNKRDMGMVFQAYSLFPHMTARQNVEFGLELRKQDKATRAKRAADMLDLVGLSKQADRFAHQMSGGQQQRVALARALAIEPQVLLLDEPLSALDAKVRTQLRDEIRRIQLEVGTTTLFVTHDQEEALAVADRVGVMNAGRLEQLAAPAELYSAPVSEFVADFVGVTNRVRAEVGDDGAHVWGGVVPLLPGSAGRGAAVLLVRPEAVVIEGGEANATVVSSSFLGGHGKVVTTTDDGDRVVVQVSNAEVTAHAPGDRVRLRPRGDRALAVAP
ncbi:MAG: ABC transporter ATP-binding protein [Actinobacteria bacterium]|jgi:ABC-type spermidine/putrescine transport systems, ATPase components|nr:ABC transporter ATP-binding protein [Actinomycetota bacterium]